MIYSQIFRLLHKRKSKRVRQIGHKLLYNTIEEYYMIWILYDSKKFIDYSKANLEANFEFKTLFF